MQETYNNCFGSKKRSTTLRQAKTGVEFELVPKCNSNEVRCCYISALVLTCFRLTKVYATYFWSEIVVAIFLDFMVLLLFKVLFNHNIEYLVESSSIKNSVFTVSFNQLQICNFQNKWWRKIKWKIIKGKLWNVFKTS